MGRTVKGNVMSTASQLSNLMEEDFRGELRRVLSDRLSPLNGPPPVRGMGAGDGAEVIEEGRRFLKSMDQVGLAVPSWPTDFGGGGLARDQMVILSEELEAYEVPDLYPFSIGHGMAGPVIMAFGTAEQQQRWLPSIRTGEQIWCQMFSEPEAGSDLASLRTRAVRDGEGWRLTGQKLWTSRAHYSQWGFALARTDSDVPKHRGITAFVVDMDAQGLELRTLRQINGDMHFSEVFLEDVWVPDDMVLGRPGDGWSVAMKTLSHERGAGDRGIGGFTSDDVIRLALRADLTDPIVRDRLAAAWINLKVAQLTSRLAEVKIAAGGDPGPGGSGSKLRQVANFKEVTALAMDILGPNGLHGEDPWTTLFLTSPSLSIRGGTDQIQRNIIAERVLGLPGEPRTDKDDPFSAKDRLRKGDL